VGGVEEREQGGAPVAAVTRAIEKIATLDNDSSR
jgi:hypothetical protein